MALIGAELPPGPGIPDPAGRGRRCVQPREPAGAAGSLPRGRAGALRAPLPRDPLPRAPFPQAGALRGPLPSGRAGALRAPAAPGRSAVPGGSGSSAAVENAGRGGVGGKKVKNKQERMSVKRRGGLAGENGC